MDQIKILTIDDELDVCKMLTQFFTNSGYNAKYAINGLQAMEIVRDFSPHFVFLDVMMPGMSGLEVLKSIRETDTTIHVVMISGMHDLGMAKEAMSLGASDYMPKPVQLEAIKSYIDKAAKEMFDEGTSDKV